MVDRLDSIQAREALANLNRNISQPWSLGEQSIYKQFKFKSFTAAFTFMGQVAEIAEAHNHHPDWSNNYNIVTIELSTHVVKGLSQRDFEMARAIEFLI
ncbi:MAG: 4a-hydroxytetrahydrobiopterin dehydratase [Porticoccaceae bacterium]